VVQRTRGKELVRRHTIQVEEETLRAGFEAVRKRLLEALRKVEAFSKLGENNLVQLRDAMTEAPFEKGDYVFEQGDVGDTFYAIVEGEAVVLREADTEPEQVLAHLGEGATFGERALLKAEPRFASIKATSKLKTMCISREAFERALGAPLHALIDDRY
jgi:CRP-like cAMP-binding protein